VRIAISLNASDVDPMEAQRVFSTAVRALRNAGRPGGEVSGSFHAGQMTVDAAEVTNKGSLTVKPAEDLELPPVVSPLPPA
jgi:hypothetical protein